MPENVSENSTYDIDSERLSVAAYCVMRTLGMAIVILNLTVMCTLVARKTKFPAVYWLQITCLALNDCVAGLAVFIISFIDTNMISSSFTNCSAIIILLFFSQSASLYNIFGISVHRFIALRRRTNEFRWKHRHTISAIVTAWGMSILLCSLPIIVFGKPDHYIRMKFCSLLSIFGEDMSQGSGILMGSFVFPLVFINIMYIILFYNLRSTWKRIMPVRTAANSEKGSLYSITAVLSNVSEPEPFFQATTSKHTADIPASVSSSCSLKGSSISISQKQISKRVVVPVRMDIELMVLKDLEDSPEHIDAKIQESGSAHIVFQPNKEHTFSTFLPGTSPKNVSAVNQEQSDLPKLKRNAVGSKLFSKPEQISQPSIRQKKAFTLLGTILLFLNIFSWPGITALLLAGMIHSISLGRGTLLPLFTTICLNSVVNPIIYTIIIKEFRVALLDIVRNLLKL